MVDNRLSNANDFGCVAVLMGGTNSERDISLKSGDCVYKSLKRSGINAVPLDVDSTVINKLHEINPDRAFIALHGGIGENGTIQAILKGLNIPYTGSGILASSLIMDKHRTKLLFNSCGIKTPDFILLNGESNLKDVIKTLGLPLVIKPVSEGSSVGVNIIKDIKEFDKAYKDASSYGCGVLAEKYIRGDEVFVGILNNEPLPVLKIKTPREFFDYEAKYLSDTTEFFCPSGLSNTLEENAKEQSKAAFFACGATSWGRVDGIIDADGCFWTIEINTIPGLSDQSTLPMSAKSVGISFDELVLTILKDTFRP